MNLADLTRTDLIFTDLAGFDAETVVRSISQRIVGAGAYRDVAKLFARLWERESIGSTGIGHGVAVPHCKIKGLGRVVLAIGRLDEAIDFGSIDDREVDVFFVILSPEKTPLAHLQALQAISHWVKMDGRLERLRSAETPEAMLALIQEDGTEPA